MSRSSVATIALLAVIAIQIATAAPVGILDAFAETCSGSGDVGPAMTGKCYGGSASVLKLSESAVVKVVSYDAATGEGMLKLDAEGMQVVHCPPATFKKEAGTRDLSVDLTGCGKHGSKLKKILAAAEYCSDQDMIRVHVKVPDTAAPGASNLPLVPVSLKPTPCKDARVELQATKTM